MNPPSLRSPLIVMQRLLCLLLLGLAGSVSAQLSLPQFFSDHLVLQREREAALWGRAAPGATVKVGF